MLIGAAIGWGAVILVLSIVFPIESVNTGRPGVQPMRSLVAVHGYGVLSIAAVPLLIAIVVGPPPGGSCARRCPSWPRPAPLRGS